MIRVLVVEDKVRRELETADQRVHHGLSPESPENVRHRLTRRAEGHAVWSVEPIVWENGVHESSLGVELQVKRRSALVHLSLKRAEIHLESGLNSIQRQRNPGIGLHSLQKGFCHFLTGKDVPRLILIWLQKIVICYTVLCNNPLDRMITS